MSGERDFASIRAGGPLATAQERRHRAGGTSVSAEEIADAEQKGKKIKELSGIYRSQEAESRGQKIKDLEEKIQKINDRIYDRVISDEGPLNNKQKAELAKEAAALGAELRKLQGSK